MYPCMPAITRPCSNSPIPSLPHWLRDLSASRRHCRTTVCLSNSGKTRYSPRAQAFQLPHSDGCEYDSTRCSVHPARRRNQRHQFRAVDANGQKLRERVKSVEFRGAPEVGNDVTEQFREKRASPSRARRSRRGERNGQFFPSASSRERWYDTRCRGRLDHQYQRLNDCRNPIG